jgi:hypothetical protein
VVQGQTWVKCRLQGGEQRRCGRWLRGGGLVRWGHCRPWSTAACGRDTSPWTATTHGEVLTRRPAITAHAVPVIEAPVDEKACARVATLGDCRDLRHREHAAMNSKSIKEHVGRLVRVQIPSNSILLLSEQKNATLLPTISRLVPNSRVQRPVDVVGDDSGGTHCHCPMHPDSVGTNGRSHKDAVIVAHNIV